MDDDSSETVIETRDVTDLQTHEEVSEAVDEMLDPSDLAEHEPSPEIQQLIDEANRRQEENDEKEDAGGTQVSVSADAESLDEYEDFDFENQEWTLDDRKDPEVRTVRGVKFLFNEPDNDDDVLNQLEGAADGERDDQLYMITSLVVDKPKLTEERWESMGSFSKLALAGQAADYLGLDEGFLEG